MYYNGRRCVPEVRLYERPGEGYYERRYERRYDPGVRIDVAPGVGVRVR